MVTLIEIEKKELLLFLIILKKEGIQNHILKELVI